LSCIFSCSFFKLTFKNEVESVVYPVVESVVYPVVESVVYPVVQSVVESVDIIR